MKNTDLKKQILELTFLVKTEEENYESAKSNHSSSAILRSSSERIQKLKNDLQVLIDKESAERKGNYLKLNGGKSLK
jgi:hypothetical protein